MIRLYPLPHRHLGGGEPYTHVIEKMKTKQTKIDRSAAKWLPGAMALAATTASSQAATVQITLTGNKISSTGNQLVADLTGDGGLLTTPGGLWPALLPGGTQRCS